MNALEENRHNIESNLAAIDAATAVVITKTAGLLIFISIQQKKFWL